MAGTIWKGVIHFGDTNVAVKLHAAVREERVQFHLLHRTDLVRLHQQMICAYEKRPVPAEAQTKGFQVEEGKFVIVDPEELEEVTPEGSRLIEVHEFVRRTEIDPIFVERVYHLEPDTATVGYGELAEALEELDAAGICTWTMRKRSYVGAVQGAGRALRLNALRYADEVVAVNLLGLQEVPVTERELQIGRELITQLTAPFAPQKFVNEHERKLRELIERKARGEKVAILKPTVLKPTPADDLLAVLEASLKKAA